MTLTDTGPLVAIIDRTDPYHRLIGNTSVKLAPGALVTTWPCLTEAMHLIRKVTRPPGQELLWDLIAAGILALRDPAPGEPARMAALMRTYRDLPMDLADASLVTAAEATGERRLFTFDAHFRVYVLLDGTSLAVVP